MNLPHRAQLTQEALDFAARQRRQYLGQFPKLCPGSSIISDMLEEESLVRFLVEPALARICAPLTDECIETTGQQVAGMLAPSSLPLDDPEFFQLRQAGLKFWGKWLFMMNEVED